MTLEKQRRTWSNRKPLLIGTLALAFFVLVIGIWGTQSSIAGAVIAAGRVQVAENMTALSHPVGGVVAELLVENGDKVSAGEVVLRLDDAQVGSLLNTVESELFETLASSARLTAIIDGKMDLVLDSLLEEQLSSNASIDTLLYRQRRQLHAHYETIEVTEASLAQQIELVDAQIVGAELELASEIEKLEFIDEELVRMNAAYADGLATTTEVQTLRKERITTEGEIGRLQTGLAALKGELLETEFSLSRFSPTLIEEAMEDLNAFQQENGKLREQRQGILNDLKELEVRAPIDGTIHDSQVQGLRSVARAGTPLMYVVPDDNPVTVSARVDTGDIDQVTLGQDAMLRFTAFNTRTLPNIFGKVSKISADALLEARTQRYFYNVEITLSAEEIAKLEENLLISGMPVSVYLTTESRSPVDYILRPISLYLDRAFRDG